MVGSGNGKKVRYVWSTLFTISHEPGAKINKQTGVDLNRDSQSNLRAFPCRTKDLLMQIKIRGQVRIVYYSAPSSFVGKQYTVTTKK